MRALKCVVCVAVASLVTLSVTDARADEECLAGYRDTTPAEQAAMTTVLRKALQAMPSAPRGWVLNSDDSLYILRSICQDDESGPWSYDVYRAFLRVDNVEERDRKLGQTAADVAAAMQAKQPRIDAIMARIQELSTAAVAAAQEGDYDKVDAVNAEIEQATAEMDRIMSEGGTLDQIDAANEDARRDTTIRVDVTVNSSYESIDVGAAKVTGPAGAKLAYRWSDVQGSVTEETALILFGRWKVNRDRVEVAPLATAAPTAAQAISVRVTADTSRIESVLGSIDFAALAALVAPGTGR